MNLIEFIKELFTNSTCQHIVLTAPTTHILYDFHNRLASYFEESDIQFNLKGRGGCRIVSKQCKIEFMSKRDLQLSRGFNEKTVFIILSFGNMAYDYFKRVILPLLESEKIQCHFDLGGQAIVDQSCVSIFKDFTTQNNMSRILDVFAPLKTSASDEPARPQVDSTLAPIHELLKRVS